MAVALADYQPKSKYGFVQPDTSYEVPQKSITASPRYLGFSPTSPSPSFRLPIHEFKDFNAHFSNLGSLGLSTPAPFLNSGFGFTTPAPSVEIKTAGLSSTPAPFVDISSPGFSTPSPLGVEISSPASFGINAIASSTVAPIADVSSAGPLFGGSAFGFTTPAPAPALDIVSSTPAPSFLNNFGFGVNTYSTPAPFAFGASSLTHLGSPLFHSDAALNGVQVTTSGGSLLDAFGPTLAPPVDAIVVNPKIVPEIRKNVYFYAAPDDHEPIRPRVRIASPAAEKKNINYIFIKAPAPAPVGPIRVAAPVKQEEKTVVYVLVKKPQEEQEIEIQAPEPAATPKPEVYFIKYKNQQEAEEAISKVQSGTATPADHLPANDVGAHSSFVSQLGKSSFVQPIVNEVKYSALHHPIPYSNLNSGLFYSTTAAPLVGSDFSLSTVAPSYSGLAVSTTPAPIFNAFPSSKFSPLLSSSFSSVGLPDASHNLVDASFASSTVAPESFVSSTIAPSPFASSLFRTSSPSPFSVYGPPLIKKK